MLYDPKWTGTFTLIDLIAWLETKDPEETYNFMDPASCLVAQWTGKKNLTTNRYAGSFNLQSIDGATFSGCQTIVWGAPDERWTFGSALERARRMLDAA